VTRSAHVLTLLTLRNIAQGMHNNFLEDYAW
jgi:hypothetical protein